MIIDGQKTERNQPVTRCRKRETEKMAIKLYEHNRVAYETAKALLEREGKAAIVHPTGTGKSFIAFKLCEENPDKKILWLSPSEYIFKTQLENLKSTSEGYTPENIVFYTYAKLTYLSDDEIEEIKPEYIILDEFHRCGAEVWGKGVQKVLRTYADVPVLGLSATNIRYLDNQRDMAEELFEGNIASEMTLGEAIVRGILNPPKYVLSVFQYQKDLEKYSYRVKHAKNKAVRDEGEKYLEALRRALDKADGLPEIFEKHMDNKRGKYIVFCANVEHMEEMTGYAEEWFGGIDGNPHIYKAYSDDPETNKAFENFKKDVSDHLKLLYCIDMLNEGVHVDDVSGVILLRPTVSPIIYKQQIGRALSASKTTNAVIFDIVMNIDNLYSIGTIEDEMQVVMTYYRERGLENEIVNEHFKVVDEVRGCIELFERLNDTLSASWEYMFGEAKRYYEKNGNLEVPKNYKTEQGYSLGSWLTTQRKVRRGEQFGILGRERIEKLDSIGMRWESYKDLSWNKYYTAAEKYYAEHGDLKVPVSYTVNGLNLGSWISNLRTYRKNGGQSSFINEERTKALNEIGMIWDVSDTLWERNYKAAKSYYKDHGNLDVPLTYVTKDGIKLGIWLNNIRGIHNGKIIGRKLTREQVESLNQIGMLWSPKFDRAWEKGYVHAKAYYENHGDLKVPSTYKEQDGYRLGAWICNQRDRKERLSVPRKEMLDEIGMIWEKTDSWEVRYILAKAYYMEHGNLQVPPKYIAEGVWLNKWLNEQKQIYRGNRNGKILTKEQIARLEEIGIFWEDKSAVDKVSVWEQNYTEAKKFYSENGHLNVPNDYLTSDGKKLNAWIIRQRALYKTKKLSAEQVARLENIGMVWTPDDAWEVGFEHARSYFKKHGDLLVMSQYVCNDGYKLGNWITNQRANKTSGNKYGKLSSEQITRLERIGMVWNVQEYQWLRSYETALQYYERNGNIRVPRGVRYGNIDLQSWVSEQRKRYKQGKLSEERICKLSRIGIITSSCRKKEKRVKSGV